MAIDLTNFSIIDNHCHPFTPSREDRPFFSYWNSSLFDIDPYHLTNSVTYYLVINRLRKFLGVGTQYSAEEVVKIRTDRYRSDPKKWVSDLYTNANITDVISDISYPITAWRTGKYISETELNEYYEIGGCANIHRAIRIEFVYNKLFDKNLSFDKFVHKYFEDARTEINKHKPVTLKSVIGYFTGLNVQSVSIEQARNAYLSYLDNRADKVSEKLLRDYMLDVSMNLCKDYQLPLQVHTGMGNTPMCKLLDMNPALLHDFLCIDRNQEIKTILLHSGYPYMRHTSYLAAHFPQVYLDVSQMIPHAGRSSERGLFELMEVSPFTKILYGSDGGSLPEHTWYTAMYFKEVLGNVLTNFVKANVFDEEKAYCVANWILKENVTQLYQLPISG